MKEPIYTEEILEVARRFGATPEEVYAEMRLAIRSGMASTDPRAQAIWRHIASDGKEPSPEDVIAAFAEMYREGRRDE